ncbi:class I SAM-dependent methyltransferase [Mycolicibacterium gilvum]|nr:class I SAM-dependent methyltransferase [Mycolicibacterium gilvum]
MFTQIDAILRPTDRVLDFGAGRGEHILDDAIEYRKRLFNLRGRCAHVEGCDVDEAVLTNPFLDHAVVIHPNTRLPYPDDSFDIIFSRFVFEHIQDSSSAAGEMLRVLKPGGLIAALTPNRFGYIALAATVIPNKFHVRALRYIQPKRKSIDVFPTKYRMNSSGAIKAAFGDGSEVYTQFVSGEPGYHFGKPFLYGIFKYLHKILPDRLQPLIIAYIRKPKRYAQAGLEV